MGGNISLPEIRPRFTVKVSENPSQWMQGWNLILAIFVGRKVCTARTCFWRDVLVEAIRISWDMWCYNATMSACEKGQQWQHALGTAAGSV